MKEQVVFENIVQQLIDKEIAFKLRYKDFPTGTQEWEVTVLTEEDCDSCTAHCALKS